MFGCATRAAAPDQYDRATEFEAVGGKVIELPAADWKTLTA
jgi:hypothetical protein